MPTTLPVPAMYAARLADNWPGFFGLDLFYKILKPSQTEQILQAILHMDDGKGQFLAQTRKIPEARAHFEQFLSRPESIEGKTVRVWLGFQGNGTSPMSIPTGQ